MKRKLIVALSVAALLVFTLAVTAMAAGPGPNAGAPAALDGTGANANAVCNFVDEDGDGICDNFVDEDGDGVCDQAPQARLNQQFGGMRGRMAAQTQGTPRSFGFDSAGRGRWQ